MRKVFAVCMVVLMGVWLSSCGSVANLTGFNPADFAISTGETAVVFNSSFTDPIGNLSTINLVGDPTATLARVTTDGSDAVIRSFGGKIYVINRFGADTIQVVNPGDFSVAADFSVGPGTNPQDIVVISDDKAYVSRLQSENGGGDTSDVLIVNPATGATLGGIDLKPYTTDDGDRFARAAQMVLVDGILYVCIQDLPSNMILPANTNGKVAMIDTATDEVIDADADTAGTQVIELAGRNPSDITYSSETGRFYVVDTGVYENFVVNTSDSNGGIEAIDRTTMKSEGIIIDDAAFGGGLSEIRLASSELGYTIVGSAAIASFNPTTGEVLSQEVYRTPAYYLPDFSIDGNDRLLIAEQDFNNPGVVILNPADGSKTGPINVGAPPVSIAFVDVK